MLRVSTALTFSALLVSSMPAVAADNAKTPTFTKDIAPIFQQKCESCHRPDNMAPMSLICLRRSASVGEVDRVARRRASDAAVAHRQDHGHPEVQERSLAQRRSDRDHPRMGGRRRAEGRSEGHARSESLEGRIGLEPGRTSSALRISSSSPPTTRCRRSRRTPGGGRRTRPASPSRAGFARSTSARSARTPARSRTMRWRVCSSPKTWIRRSSPTTRTSPATACSWNGRSARTATRCVRTPAV